MKNQDYKIKYEDLKLKFHDAIDVAFRLGFEQGAQSSQMKQAEQAQAMAQSGGMPGQEQPQDSQEFGQQPSDGSELDQHIGTLESMLQKSDPTSPEALSLKKSLDGIRSFQSTLRQASELKKSEHAIKEIGKAMKKPLQMRPTATKNLSEHGKKALNDQEKIVEELMKSFAEEEKKVTEAITKTLDFEQVLKG
jgi:hypothetical protein